MNERKNEKICAHVVTTKLSGNAGIVVNEINDERLTTHEDKKVDESVVSAKSE